MTASRYPLDLQIGMSQHGPIVSVLTPVFNASRWLPEMLDSVAAQTFADWEHILTDDGSSDDSVTIIESAAARDPRIRLLRMPVNGGPARARNMAIEAACGRYLAFLDADDLWLPQKLEHCLQFMDKNDCAMVYHAFRYLSADGGLAGALVQGPPRLTLKTLHTRRGTGDCMSMVIDRSKIRDFSFPLTYERSHEDWSAWLRVLRQGHIGRLLPEDLGRYRLSSNSRNANKLSAACKVWRLYHSEEGLARLRAVFWWTQYIWNSFWLHLRSKPSAKKQDDLAYHFDPKTQVTGAKRRSLASLNTKSYRPLENPRD